MEYLASETSARQKAGAHRILMSKTDHSALMRMYKCSEKGSVYFDGLMNLSDKDIAQSVQFFMNVLNITDFASLVDWAASVRNYADVLMRRQRDGKEGISGEEFSLLKKLNNAEEDNKEMRPVLLVVMSLFCEMCGEDFAPKSALAEYLEIIAPYKVTSLYKMLFHTITAYRKRERKPSKQTPEAAPQNPEAPKTESPTPAAPDENTVKLLEQIDDLKAELEGAYIRLNASEENYADLQNEGHEAAVNEVLGLMNSQDSGMLLDQFARAENTLRQLAAKKIDIPEELSSLSLCVKIFMRTMRNVFGVSPVLKTGEILEVSLDQAQRYIYSGSDFADDEEAKKVEVIASGWKRGEEIFSLPRIVEHR